MATMPWQEQIAYYRARAAEYDLTSYRDVHGADRRIAALVAHLQPSGELLEIACGTRMWTRHLAGCAASVTAIDAAPEMIALARQRVTAGNMTFLTADILTWAPPRRFDAIFFAFWLSHVPASMFGRFWSLLRTALTSSGRVLFVDDQPAAAGLEACAAGLSEVAERRLRDGTRHRLIKVIRDRPDLTRQLTELGWHATITRSGDWLVGQARPAAITRAIATVARRRALSAPRLPGIGRRADHPVRDASRKVMPRMVAAPYRRRCAPA